MDVGYSKNTAKKPSNLTASKGFAELVEMYLPDDKILNALSDDIDLKPQNRTPELTLAAKIKGMIIDKRDLTSKGEKLESNTIVFTEFSDETEGK